MSVPGSDLEPLLLEGVIVREWGWLLLGESLPDLAAGNH